MSNIKKTCLLKAHVSGRLFFDMFFYHTEQVLVYNKVNILLPRGDFAQMAKSRGGFLVTRARFKESIYS